MTPTRLLELAMDAHQRGQHAETQGLVRDMIDAIVAGQPTPRDSLVDAAIAVGVICTEEGILACME